ncbi:MAG: phosphopantetheine-binding protein, partial [Schlesneria sp.]
MVNELRQYLHDKLPDYMIPAALVTLDDLPLTANGKVDKLALPRPDDTWHDRKQDFVSPRNAVEETLASAWSSVLGIKRISVHDNFFELGGHSLLAVRV